ncbi:MAG: hypothetical protein WCD47_00315 [Candidatus Sulfotelmatobacter sp.]
MTMLVIAWKTLVEDPCPRGRVNPVVRHGKGRAASAITPGLAGASFKP